MKPSARKLSAWYHQMGQLLEAGIPVPRALHECGGVTPAGRKALADSLQAGDSIADALGRAGQWLPAADRIALAFSAAAGRLPETFMRLSERRKMQADTARRLMAACLYPIIVLHLAIVAAAIPHLVDAETGLSWHGGVFMTRVLPPLGLLWAVLAVIAGIVRMGGRPAMAISAVLPGFRRYVRNQDMADFCHAMGHFVAAGLSIAECWQAAGKITRRRDLQQAAAGVVNVIGRGEAPSAHLGSFACFPELFMNQYRNGEMTGQLDRHLLWLAAHYQDCADDGLRLACIVYPLVCFLFAAAWVASGVLRTYRGYLDALTGLAG